MTGWWAAFAIGCALVVVLGSALGIAIAQSFPEERSVPAAEQGFEVPWDCSTGIYRAEIIRSAFDYAITGHGTTQPPPEQIVAEAAALYREACP